MQRLQTLWITLRSSLWFVPTLVVTAMVLLAVALVEVDTGVGAKVLENWPRLFGAQADGTRGMLSAIASAMITVAGVVFSITIVALSLTSSQYTSRVLRNFMRDRSNQVVLGAFVGIYAYCLVVIRTIRGGDEAPFVPSLATLGAIVLAFVGIALLIHFIHHISSAIQAAQILAAIRTETIGPIERLFPDDIGENDDESDDPEVHAILEAKEWRVVDGRSTGYVQAVDGDAIERLASEHDVLIHLPRQIGDFVIAGTPLIRIRGADVPEDVERDLCAAFAVGNQRTVDQDPAFGIRQIVDVAVKALSPGINDPTTATMSLDHLSVLLRRLAERRFPSRLRYVDGKLRVIARAATFENLLACGIDEIRLAAATQPIVLARLLGVLRTVAESTRSRGRRRLLAEHAARVAASCSDLHDKYARAALAKEAHDTLEAINSGSAPARGHRPAHARTRTPRSGIKAS